ncbi:MAG: hypothetical protein HLUCCA08_05800 [Rhodobacteraceae bacterium HLUCCA08]|nr:MAG: hypothetical protein HLUCCA08_05800 [Rhodobacteraceae bacterium HLUCCA08]
MSWLSRLLGGSGTGGERAAAAEPVAYEGFRIYPEPIPEDGQFRLAARIEMGEGEALKTHHMIRADLLRDRDEAVEAAIRKAQQMIDQLGARIFD